MFLINLISPHNILQPIWAIIVNDNWQPSIGDPSFMGWVTVGIYFITAFLCSWCAWRTFQLLSIYRFHHYYWLWLGFSICLIILGINKQLDLQSWFTIVGKNLAISQGWYLQRRYIQVAFISGIAFLFIACFFYLSKLVKKDWKIFRLTFFGFLFLSSFILIRASSFHHIDQLIGLQIVGFRLNWFLEIGGLLCISLSCFNYLSHLQRLKIKSQTKIDNE
ncbi:hypothetical protein [Aphanothece hegewaldii]|uniref:hypothetical protein n=1 Tax=Aphanothece hegewaldii TaxID=1521625 RepID=UPI0015E6DAD2|nr:hypothetical protein [Aphanothece hegewaldii]